MFLGVPVTLIGRGEIHLCGNSVLEAAVLTRASLGIIHPVALLR